MKPRAQVGDTRLPGVALPPTGGAYVPDRAMDLWGYSRHMPWWLREYADTIALAAIGAGSVLIGLLLNEQEIFSTVITLAGIAILVFSVLVRRIDRFGDGANVVDGRLVQLEAEVESIKERLDQQVVAAGAESARPSGEPILVPDPPV